MSLSVVIIDMNQNPVGAEAVLGIIAIPCPRHRYRESAFLVKAAVKQFIGVKRPNTGQKLWLGCIAVFVKYFSFSAVSRRCRLPGVNQITQNKVNQQKYCAE